MYLFNIFVILDLNQTECLRRKGSPCIPEYNTDKFGSSEVFGSSQKYFS